MLFSLVDPLRKGQTFHRYEPFGDSEAWRPGFRDDAGRHSEMNPAAIPK